jgi:hypothetical protein
MAILKYSYLILGIGLYIAVNVVSYNSLIFPGELGTKILFSVISFLLLLLDYATILFTKELYKRPFSDFTTYVKVSLYIGVIIIPLISLYYT